MVGYSRGMTPKIKHDPAARPPKKTGRVANDVAPMPRSAMMPPPTTDTQEPRLSRKTSGTSFPKGKTFYGETSVTRPRASSETPMGHPSATPRPKNTR